MVLVLVTGKGGFGVIMEMVGTDRTKEISEGLDTQQPDG
jgi:hypothetical protein